VRTAIHWSDLLFGRGDDNFPAWLLTVRINVVVFVVCGLSVVAWSLAHAPLRRAIAARAEVALVLSLTALAAWLRFSVATTNLMDFGGIAYSRLLLGYKGYFATAQVFSPLYQLTSRDIEHAILFDRFAGILTIPLVYILCRHLQVRTALLAPVAAFLFAVYPLHVLFSASDALAIFSGCLAAAAYLLLAAAERPLGGASEPRAAQLTILSYLGGFSGLALLTQVRYENGLLLVPPALVLLGRRHSLLWRRLLPGLLVGTLFLAIYAHAMLTSGSAYAAAADFSRNLDLVIWHLVLNPLMAVPFLLLGTLAIPLFDGWRVGVIALLPWFGALTLAVLASSDAHGVARIYANWLILILPFAGYGFALLLAAQRRVANAIAVGGLLLLGAQPFLMGDCLGARYLDILENDRFKALVTTLPPNATSIIVPDNELMWRQSHTTLEVDGKYAMILAGTGEAARRRTLVRLTEFLEHPERTSCADGACVFFSGLPCTDLDMYLFTRGQCADLLRTHRASILDEATVTAAPFAHCSIYTGEQRRQQCMPTTRPQRFVLYRIEQ